MGLHPVVLVISGLFCFAVAIHAFVLAEGLLRHPIQKKAWWIIVRIFCYLVAAVGFGVVALAWNILRNEPLNTDTIWVSGIAGFTAVPLAHILLRFWKPNYGKR